MQFAFTLAHLTSPKPKTLVGLLGSSRIILDATSRRRVQVARACLPPMLQSTRTTTGTCGILQRPRRRLRPRSLEGAYTIMRTRRTRSIRGRRPSWSQRKFGITVSMVPINPRGARGHRQDRRKAGRIGGSSFSMSWLGRLVSLSSMP